MPGNIRDTASGSHILRVGLLVGLLLGASGCDLLDVLSVPGRSGGSIWLTIPLGLGGNVGILNPTGNQTASNQTTNNNSNAASSVPVTALSGSQATSASASIETASEPSGGGSGTPTSPN